jgi:DNA repair exonuclease SbcCD ATPase subunit
VTDTKKTKTEEAKAAKNAATIAKAEAINLEGSLAGITKASLEAQEAFAEVGKRLQAKYEELSAVEDAIKLKKEDLKLLHGQDKLLKEISELEAEKAKIEATNKQLEEDLQVARDREEAEFQYKRNQERKAEDDARKETLRLEANKERDRKEAFEKDLKTREEVLQTKETDYQQAIAKIATFDSELDKRVNAEVGKEKGILTSKFEAEKRIIAVEHKAQIDGLNKDIEHANKTIVAKEIELASLREQLAKAVDSQTALAKATVEGANDKKALADAQSLITNVGSNGRGPTARS